MTTTPLPEDVVLEVVQHPDRTVVVVSGEIDVRTAPELRRVLFDPQVAVATLVVVDLAAVTFLDSVGIGALVAARRWLTSRGTGLVLVCGQTQPRRVLTMTGLHKVFEILEPVAAEPAAPVAPAAATAVAPAVAPAAGG